MTSSMADSVFLSYRRDDSEGQTGRLYDRLNLAFPGRIFRDLSGIDVGVNFEKRILEAMQASAACIVVLGRNWATIKNKQGEPRLFQPNDYVRFEVRTALQRGLQVLPVFVDGAEMPAQTDLPDDLHPLTAINGMSLLEADYDHMVDKLIARLEPVIGKRAPKGGDFSGTIDTLRRRAQICGSQEDWTGAIQLLQAAISMNPANGDVAGDLRNAQQQMQLAGLYADAQRRLQMQDRTGALERFRQIRDTAGAYRDTLALIASIEGGMREPVRPPAPLPKPKSKKRWLALGAAVFVVLAIIGAVQDSQSRRTSFHGGERPNGPAPKPEYVVAPEVTQPLVDDGPLGQPANTWLVGTWWLYPEQNPAQKASVTFNNDGSFTMVNQWGYFNGGGQYYYDHQTHTLTMNGTAMPVEAKQDHFHVLFNGAVWALRR